MTNNHQQKDETTDRERAIYWLGRRDMLADILAMGQKTGLKYPALAETYKDLFEGEHFTHEWHIL